MPLVEITLGTGTLTSEQKTNLGKAVHNEVKKFFQDAFKDMKGVKFDIWVVIREESSDSYIVNGESISEIRKKIT